MYEGSRHTPTVYGRSQHTSTVYGRSQHVPALHEGNWHTLLYMRGVSTLLRQTQVTSLFPGFVLDWHHIISQMLEFHHGCLGICDVKQRLCSEILTHWSVASSNQMRSSGSLLVTNLIEKFHKYNNSYPEVNIQLYRHAVMNVMYDHSSKFCREIWMM